MATVIKKTKLDTRRIEFFVPPPKMKIINDLCVSEGFTRAELMRRALDFYFLEYNKEKTIPKQGLINPIKSLTNNT